MTTHPEWSDEAKREHLAREKSLHAFIELLRVARRADFSCEDSINYRSALVHDRSSWREEREGRIDTIKGLAYCIVSPVVEYNASGLSHVGHIAFLENGDHYDFFVRQEATWPNAMDFETLAMTNLIRLVFYEDASDGKIYTPYAQAIEIRKNLPHIAKTAPIEPSAYPGEHTMKLLASPRPEYPENIETEAAINDEFFWILSCSTETIPPTEIEMLATLLKHSTPVE